MHTCHYCRIYQKIDEKLRRSVYKGEEKNKKRYHYRFCEEIREEVQSTSEPCESFAPAKYFWCKADHNWMFVVSCLNRKCDCSQKDDLLDAIRGFNIEKEFGMKPKLVKNAPVEKPKLTRRKKPILVKRKKPKLLLVRKVK